MTFSFLSSHIQGLVPGASLKPINVGAGEAFDVIEQYLFPMLAGLSDLTSDQRSEVRNCALEVLFDLLNERGGNFSSSFWEYIFQRILFPIFDHVRQAGKESSMSSGDEWPRESSVHALQLLCNLFNTFYKVAQVVDDIQSLVKFYTIVLHLPLCVCSVLPKISAQLVVNTIFHYLLPISVCACFYEQKLILLMFHRV